MKHIVWFNSKEEAINQMVYSPAIVGILIGEGEYKTVSKRSIVDNDAFKITLDDSGEPEIIFETNNFILDTSQLDVIDKLL